MKALQSITDLFRQQVSEAIRLEVWAEDGALFSAQGTLVDGYELEYTAIIFMQCATVRPEVLFMHLVSWLNQNDPDRQEKGLAFPTFAVEPLDNGKFDIKIKLDLRESYTLQPSEDGPWVQEATRYECVSEFTPVVNAGELGELRYVVGNQVIGHQEDMT